MMMMIIINKNYYYYYLRAAAPAADPGKESGIAGETGKLCDEKLWQIPFWNPTRNPEI